VTCKSLLAVLAFAKLIFGNFLKNTVSSRRGSKRNDDGGNPIAAKPLRAMGLPAFYHLFSCRAGILHYAAPPVRLGLVDARK